MSEGNDAIAFKKDNPQRVASSAKQQLTQPRLFRLGEKMCYIGKIIKHQNLMANSTLTIDKMTRAGNTPITV